MATTSDPLDDLVLRVFNKIKESKLTDPPITETVLHQLFKILFYTSLKTEEGQYIKVTVTLIDPNDPDPLPPRSPLPDRWQFVKFKKRIPLDVKNLTKLSKAADIWSSSVAVYFDANGNLFIWGMLDQALHYQSFLNYEIDSKPEQPGLIQVTIKDVGSLFVLMGYELIAHLRQEVVTTKYIDVFNYGEIRKILESNNSDIESIIEGYLQKKYEPLDYYNEWKEYVRNEINQSITRLLLRIQNYQHGGAILITDDFETNLEIKYFVDYQRLSSSIIKVIKAKIDHYNAEEEIFVDYLDQTPQRDIPPSLHMEETENKSQLQHAKNELKGAIRFVGSLSCVDGLVLMDQSLNVKGFGVIIKMKRLPVKVYISRNATINDDRLIEAEPNSFGTRHQSMFYYCWRKPGSIGFVISQDGDIRAISKIDDKIIMWENIKIQQFVGSKRRILGILKSLLSKRLKIKSK